MSNPCKGVAAPDEAVAETILNFKCPTRDALGRWHRCTIALSNVPVIELYNILSNIRLIAHRLREIAPDSPEIIQEANRLERLNALLKRKDHV